MLATGRRRLLLRFSIWALIFGVACTLLGASLQLDRTQVWLNHVKMKWHTNSSSSQDYCTSDEIVNGAWMERSQYIVDEDGLREAFHYMGEGRHKACLPYGMTKLPESGWYHPEIQKHRFRIANQQLIPRNGCTVRREDFTGMLIRFLRMPAGGFLIGDSVGRGMEDVLENEFLTSNGLFLRTDINHKRNITLNPASIEARKLLEIAGVSEERLRFPWFTYIRSIHLASEEQLRNVFSDPPDFKLKDAGHFGDWYTFLCDTISMARKEVKFAAGILEEPTAILLDSGPHWTSDKFVANGFSLTDEELTKGFGRMVDIVARQMRQFKEPLALFWRTIAPAHLDCQLDISPDNKRTTAQSPVSPNRRAYNYHLFQRFNTFISDLAPEDHRGPRSYHQFAPWPSIWLSTKQNPPFRVVDVWPMSLKRPDAHYNPPQDCLHFCATGVYNAWNSLWYHMLLEETRNRADMLDS